MGIGLLPLVEVVCGRYGRGVVTDMVCGRYRRNSACRGHSSAVNCIVILANLFIDCRFGCDGRFRHMAVNFNIGLTLYRTTESHQTFLLIVVDSS